MDREGEQELADVQVTSALSLADLRAALRAGWSDFLTHSRFGLFFASIFVAGGLALAYLSASRGEAAWLIPAAAGFPLLAPFAAVGLYEVSRRREANLPLGWKPVLGALLGRGDDQILSMGGIIFVAFGFWMIVAHGVFAIFLGQSGLGSDPLAIFESSAGVAMVLVGSVIGGAMALGFYAITVISLPMLVDRDVDFLTAIITSLRVVRSNTAVMLTWAFLVGALLFVAMIPLFLGLMIVLPVLGHATWHLYRCTVERAERAS